MKLCELLNTMQNDENIRIVDFNCESLCQGRVSDLYFNGIFNVEEIDINTSVFRIYIVIKTEGTGLEIRLCKPTN